MTLVRSRSRPFVALVASASLVGLAACGGDGTVTSREASAIDGDASPTDTTTSADATPATGVEPVTGDFAIEWDSEEDVSEGTIEVPIDYTDPEAGSFSLHVVRNQADRTSDRIGALLVNPGGPGFGGSDYALYADSVYGKDLLDHFDIIGWDPRGTGLSTPAIDCIDDYDPYFAEVDITPDDDSERQRLVDNAEQFAGECERKNSEILGFIGTNNTARDMEAIRLALGEEQVSYFGFSYGSELGATWATMFPGSVRAAVLDGASDPTADLDTGALKQYKGFESSLATFLADCSEDRSCEFHNDGDAEGAYDDLMDELDENPIPSSAERPDVNRVVAVGATVTAMYASSSWPQLARALADAQDGDGEELMTLYDSYYQRKPDGTWGNEQEAFQAIVCMDTADRKSVEDEDAQAAEYQEVSPRLSPGTTGDYFCTFFPESADPRIDITGAGAGSIVVIGTTGDPATPLDGTKVMADTLEEGALVVVDANEHTGYSVSPCAQDVVHNYLVDGAVPDDGTECD